MLIIKQIFQYHVMQENYLFSPRMKKEQMRNESKINKFVFNFFFFKKKGKHVRV